MHVMMMHSFAKHFVWKQVVKPIDFGIHSAWYFDQLLTDLVNLSVFSFPDE